MSENSMIEELEHLCRLAKEDASSLECLIDAEEWSEISITSSIISKMIYVLFIVSQIKGLDKEIIPDNFAQPLIANLNNIESILEKIDEINNVVDDASSTSENSLQSIFTELEKSISNEGPKLMLLAQLLDYIENALKN